MALVSVIVPVYKVEEVLNYCIDTILNQTFKDFELILVDDGSPDNSGKICDMYAEKDKRITVIHKANGGVSSARNAGIERATGKYICFVDSDDYIAEDYIECLVNTKEKYPNVKNIWCSFFVLSNNSKDVRINSYEDDNSGKVISISRNEFMTLHEKWLDPMPWNKLYEAEIIKSNNIKMDEDLSLGEDFLFNVEYLDFADSDDIIIINKPLIYYKSDNENSLDGKYYENLLQIYQKINSNVEKYLIKWNLNEVEKKKYFNMVYFSYERIFRNTMNQNNSDSFFKKIKYNNSIIKSYDFRNCIKNMEYKLPFAFKISYLFKNYYFMHLYIKITSKFIEILGNEKSIMSNIKKMYYKFHIDKVLGMILSAFVNCFSKKLNIYDVDKTVEYIINNKCSVARFGDGELHIATEGCGIGFQKADKELQKKLCDVLKTKSDKLLLCLPSPINDFSYMTPSAKEVWKKDLKFNRYYWYKIIDKSVVYGDTQFTRPYIDYQNRENSRQRFENIKKIWKDKKILIVEGEKSRLGVNNDLFDGAVDIKRILCPAKDAFSKYDDILNEVLKHSNEYLILIALGPTATVLAKELSDFGYQAIDIGHLDIEYEWCKMNAKEKVAVTGKYTNEISIQSVITDEKNAEYISQICGRIK